MASSKIPEKVAFEPSQEAQLVAAELAKEPSLLTALATSEPYFWLSAFFSHRTIVQCQAKLPVTAEVGLNILHDVSGKLVQNKKPSRAKM